MATIVISPVTVTQFPEGSGHFRGYLQSETRGGMARRAVPYGKGA